jgi:hypothetical protein
LLQPGKTLLRLPGAQLLAFAYLTAIFTIIFLLGFVQYLEELGRGLIASEDRLAPSTRKKTA